MRIGIYAKVFANRKTGVGNYAYNLLKFFPEIFPNSKFFLISKNKPLYNPLTNNFEIITEQNKYLKKLPIALWFRYFAHRYINKLDLDYLWIPHIPTPKFVNKKTKLVLTVYDLNLYIEPSTMEFKTRLHYSLFFAKSVKEADFIISISKGTREKLKLYLNKNTDEIIYPAVDKKVFRKIENKAVKQFLKEKGINFRYILFVSTLEPRKNVKSLIEAYLELKKEGLLKDIKLILIGSYGWKSQNLIKLINSNRKDIIHLGYVEDWELPYFYNGSDVFILPSKYEGFGIPVLEARSCGKCVITTDIPELREACGKGCIYIKLDKNSIKEALINFFKGNLKCSNFKDFNRDWYKEALKFKNIFKF